MIGSWRCLLLLWLVGEIALVLGFRQSFENCSIRSDYNSDDVTQIGFWNVFVSGKLFLLVSSLLAKSVKTFICLMRFYELNLVFLFIKIGHASITGSSGYGCLVCVKWTFHSTLFLYLVPKPKFKVSMDDITMFENKSVIFKCRLSSKGIKVNITWYKDSHRIGNSDRTYKITSFRWGSRLRIRRARSWHAGTFECMVQGPGGVVAKKALLKIIGANGAPTAGINFCVHLFDVNVQIFSSQRQRLNLHTVNPWLKC